jgi:hypothetical protein
MELKEIDSLASKVKTGLLKKTTCKISLGEIFNDRMFPEITEEKFYIAYFNEVPDSICINTINCEKANKWFEEFYRNDVKNVYINKIYFTKKGATAYQHINIYYVLYEDLFIYFNMANFSVKLLFRKTGQEKLDPIIAGLLQFTYRKAVNKSEISLLVYKDGSIATKTMTLSKPRLNINDNYNDDFKIIHQAIVKRLTKNNDKGLVLLYGKPGTGKTSYIRYLLASTKKKAIFLPPNMAAAITSPDLIAILIDNPNSIFIIEDAENIIMDREQEGQSPVSALLNITDGLLADCLNLQLICSFNTDISKVDKALMRKGRLIAKYEFKELVTEKAQALSNKLGFKNEIFTPMNLTAIYNQEEKDFAETKQRNTIGFRINNN